MIKKKSIEDMTPEEVKLLATYLIQSRTNIFKNVCALRDWLKDNYEDLFYVMAVIVAPDEIPTRVQQEDNRINKDFRKNMDLLQLHENMDALFPIVNRIYLTENITPAKKWYQIRSVLWRDYPLQPNVSKFLVHIFSVAEAFDVAINLLKKNDFKNAQIILGRIHHYRPPHIALAFSTNLN